MSWSDRSGKFFTFFFATIGILEGLLAVEFLILLSAYFFLPFTPPDFGRLLGAEFLAIVLIAALMAVVAMVPRLAGQLGSGRRV